MQQGEKEDGSRHAKKMMRDEQSRKEDSVGGK